MLAYACTPPFSRPPGGLKPQNPYSWHTIRSRASESLVRRGEIAVNGSGTFCRLLGA